MEVSKMASTIQIRVDDDLKSKSDQLFKDLGTDTTSAIRMFLTQAVAYNGSKSKEQCIIRIHLWQKMRCFKDWNNPENLQKMEIIEMQMMWFQIWEENIDYKVVVTAEAEEDLNQFIQYLLLAKKNKQAAKNVLDDFEDTVELLKHVAGSLKTCDNPRLQSLGYHRINFQKHRYFMLYRIEDDVIYVDDIFHELQDYENRMI